MSTYVKPIKVKGTILAKIDNYNYRFGVDGYEEDIHVTISANLRMVFGWQLTVGSEWVTEVSPKDPTRGRIFRRSGNLFGY